MKISFTYALLIFMFFSLTIQVHTQGVVEVSFGERPPIDLEKIPADAYEPGKLRIQLDQFVFEMIHDVDLVAGASGYVVTGHAGLDALNRDFKAENYSQLFAQLDAAYESNPQHRQKHEAWGFHRWFEISLPAGSDIIKAVQRFSALPEVEIAEPEYRKQLVVDEHDFVVQQNESPPSNILTLPSSPNDQHFGHQWHYHNTGQQNGTPGCDINLMDAWNIETGYADVIVAIVDGGIQTNHSDLAANMWPGMGYNFVNNNSTILPHNHGTHVAGTVAAVTNNSIGVAGVAGGSGTGDGVRLMSCQVFTNTGNGGFHLAPIWAADNGAAISQNSWGYTQAGVYEISVLNAIDYFNANGGGNALNGGITIFAAGNSNSNALWYPACYSGAFSVAATNNQDAKTWYSNYASWIDVSAPGGETHAVASRGVLSTLTSNSYGYYQGTSMACPHVSGAAALMVSYALRNGLVLDNTDLKNILISSTDNHYSQNQSFIGLLGSGRINAANALLEVQDLLSGILNPNPFNAEATGTGQINLSWQLNTSSDSVMIAYSNTNCFGVPSTGTNYMTGDSIPEGGTVIYKGVNNNFIHENLDAATTYYYRIWSYNSDHEYSSGRIANATTHCGMLTALPFFENFDASNNLPSCWEIVDHQGNGQVWKIGVFSHKVSGTTGNVAYLNSDAYGSGNSQNSDLITPVFDFSGYTDITLTFQHYFRQFNSTSSATLAYSTDNGASWVNIQTWTSNTLNPSTFSQLIPGVAGQSDVRFKWNYIGNYSYYWSIDDVGISGIPSAPAAYFTADTTEVYPGDIVTFTEEIGSSSYSTLDWDFGTGAVPATASGSGPHPVLYETTGCKTVSLVIDGTTTEIKEDYILVKDYHTLTIEMNGAGTVLVDNEPYSGPLLYHEGVDVTLQAVGDSSFAFTGWGGEISGCENPFSITMNADLNVTANFSRFATAIHNEGHISTDKNFQNISDNSSCPGILQIPVPYIAQITSASVSYQMTASGTGQIADQRSQIRCVSPDGMAEATIYEGTGSHTGTYQYFRNGLDIANNVSGTGSVMFELHAGRINGGEGCNVEFNHVENNSWIVTVFYDLVPCVPTVLTLTSDEVSSNSAQINGDVLCCGGTSYVYRGFYYSTEPDPVMSGNQLLLGEGTGIYTCVLDDLNPSTTYFYTAYATNELGTSYGETYSFTTEPPSGLPAMVILENILVNSSQDTCVSASQQIIVAGNGSQYVIETGGFAELVAGESIVFLPGTEIKDGGNLLARIAVNGDYCLNPTSLPASDNEEVAQWEPSENKVKESFYKLFPNPVRDQLNLDLDFVNITEKVIITIYGMLGERLLSMEFNDYGRHSIDLSALPAGLYIVHVSKRDEVFIEKVIKQ